MKCTKISWRLKGRGNITAFQKLLLNRRDFFFYPFYSLPVYCVHLTICCELLVTRGCLISGEHTNRCLSVLSHMHTHTQVLLCHQGPPWRCSLQLLNAVLCRLKFRKLCTTQPDCLRVCLLPGGLVLVSKGQGHLDRKHTVRQTKLELHKYHVPT